MEGAKQKSISRYRLIRQIGCGTTADVFLARDTKYGADVVVKFPHSRNLDRVNSKQSFVREAYAALVLNHPNICKVHTIRQADDGRIFMVMAYCEGQTLREKLTGIQSTCALHDDENPKFLIPGANATAGFDSSSQRILPIPDILDLASQIAGGLQAAHAMGVIHCDLNPSNIVITGDQLVKIIDFGIQLPGNESSNGIIATRPGTLEYLSPEQLLGERVDHRTDIWSLGVILYEMLTGTLPFTGVYEQAVIFSVLNEKQPDVSQRRPDTPFLLSQIVDRCLQKEPDARYQHVSELRNDLLDITTHPAIQKSA